MTEQLVPCALAETCQEAVCPLKIAAVCRCYVSEDDLREMAETDKKLDDWHRWQEYQAEVKLSLGRK